MFSSERGHCIKPADVRDIVVRSLNLFPANPEWLTSFIVDESRSVFVYTLFFFSSFYYLVPLLMSCFSGIVWPDACATTFRSSLRMTSSSTCRSSGFWRLHQRSSSLQTGASTLFFCVFFFLFSKYLNKYVLTHGQCIHTACPLAAEKVCADKSMCA